MAQPPPDHCSPKSLDFLQQAVRQCTILQKFTDLSVPESLFLEVVDDIQGVSIRTVDLLAPAINEDTTHRLEGA